MAKLMRFLMLVAVVGLVAGPAMAYTVWDNSGNDGDWSVAGNWTLGVPDSADHTYICNGATVSMYDGALAADDLWLGNAASTSGTIAWNKTTTSDLTLAGNLYVGDTGGTGTVDMSQSYANGRTLSTTTSHNIYVGSHAAGIGTVTQAYGTINTGQLFISTLADSAATRGYYTISGSATLDVNTSMYVGGGGASGVGIAMFKAVGSNVSITVGNRFYVGQASSLNYELDSGGVSTILCAGDQGADKVELNSSTLGLSVGAHFTDTFLTLIDNNTGLAVDGTFNGLAQGGDVTIGTYGGVTYTGKMSYIGTDAGASTGGANVMIYDVVPEPATMSLLLLGLPFALRRRRRA